MESSGERSSEEHEAAGTRQAPGRGRLVRARHQLLQRGRRPGAHGLKDASAGHEVGTVPEEPSAPVRSQGAVRAAPPTPAAFGEAQRAETAQREQGGEQAPGAWAAVRRPHWAVSEAERTRRRALLASRDEESDVAAPGAGGTEPAGVDPRPHAPAEKEQGEDVSPLAPATPLRSTRVRGVDVEGHAEPGTAVHQARRSMGPGPAVLSSDRAVGAGYSAAPTQAAAPAPSRQGPAEVSAAGPEATRATTRSTPAIALPDGRSMATATAAAYLGHQALSAWRRQARGRLAPAARLPWVLSTPQLTAWDGVGTRPAPGSHGWLAAALAGRMRGDEADKVASALALLAASPPAALSSALADDVCWVEEGARDLTVALRSQNAGPAQTNERRLGDQAAGAPARQERGVGWPLPHGTLLDLEGVSVPTRGAAPPEHALTTGDGPPPGAEELARALAWTPAYAPHPVPLLVPLGAVAEDRVWHVNLAALGNLLIAAGSVGGAEGLALTLLAHITAQARPEEVDLLVVAANGTALAALEGLPHLCAPVVDPRDGEALSAALTTAEERVLARTAWQESPESGDSSEAGAPGSSPGDGDAMLPPRLLVVLDRVEEWALDWALALRLHTLGVAGPPAGVTLLATTAAVSALGITVQAHKDPASPPVPSAGEGTTSLGSLLLSVFGGRVSYRLDSVEESKALLGVPGAERLEERGLLVAVRGDEPEGQGAGAQPRAAAPPARLRALALSESAAAEVLTAVAETTRRPGARQRAAVGEPDERAADGERTLEGQDPPREAGAPAPTRADDGPVVGLIGRQDLAGEEREPVVAAAAPSSSGTSDTGAPHEEAPMPVISVMVLGEQRAYAAGRSLLESEEEGTPAPLTPMALSLLTYLLLQRGRPVSGEKIAADLWPESRASAKSFHKTIKRLREGLGRVLGASGAEVVRRSGALYTLHLEGAEVDALQVEELLARAESAEETTRAALWWRVVDLYTGDLCGSDPPEWAREDRARLHDAVTRMVRRLSRWEENNGNLRAAVTAAERLAQLEPDDEALHRLVMRLHARSGDRVAALQHYQRLVATLHAEVGADVEPEEETRELYRRIAAHEAHVEQGTPLGLDDEEA